jgi:uncharacterized protein YegL
MVNQSELAAAQLRGKAKLICIGITNNIDMNELKEICDEDMIFTEDNASQLKNILTEVSEEICPELSKNNYFCCCSPNIIWNLGLGRGN